MSSLRKARRASQALLTLVQICASVLLTYSIIWTVVFVFSLALFFINEKGIQI